MLYIAADHGGLTLKNKILTYLRDNNVEVTDMGAFEHLPKDDYPDYVLPTMENLQQNSADKAILLCRNGVGVNIFANKFQGIRAGLSWNKAHAQSQRNDDDTNVLTLPANYISETEAIEIVETWLNTPFSNHEKHIRRLEKINNYDNSRNT